MQQPKFKYILFYVENKRNIAKVTLILYCGSFDCFSFTSLYCYIIPCNSVHNIQIGRLKKYIHCHGHAFNIYLLHYFLLFTKSIKIYIVTFRETKTKTKKTPEALKMKHFYCNRK